MISQIAVVLSFVLCGLGVAQPPIVPSDAVHGLEIAVHETSIGETKGNPGNPCALILGLKPTSVVLPGDATLLIEPLAILAIGPFDEQGESYFDFGHLIPQEGVSALAQAITLIHDSTFFATSPVLKLVY